MPSALSLRATVARATLRPRHRGRGVFQLRIAQRQQRRELLGFGGRPAGEDLFVTSVIAAAMRHIGRQRQAPGPRPKPSWPVAYCDATAARCDVPMRTANSASACCHVGPTRGSTASAIVAARPARAGRDNSRPRWSTSPNRLRRAAFARAATARRPPRRPATRGCPEAANRAAG